MGLWGDTKHESIQAAYGPRLFLCQLWRGPERKHAVQRADRLLEEGSQLRHGLTDAEESNLAGSGQQSVIPSA